MAKHIYECMLISPPDQNEAARAPLRERIESVLKKFGSSIVHSEDWGSRRLTFRINKNWRGHYTVFYFEAEPACVTELDRTFKITDDAWRHIIIRPEERPDFAELERRAKARAEAEKERAAGREAFDEGDREDRGERSEPADNDGGDEASAAE